MTDAVNHPNHYLAKPDVVTLRVRGALLEDMDTDILNVECFIAMVSMLSVGELRGYLRGNSFKYRWRYRSKSGAQDLKKAQWYEKKLLVLESTIEQFMEENPDA